MLLEQYASTACISNLPQNIQQHLASTNVNRGFNIEIACSERGPDDAYDISLFELETALEKGRATSPGDDGITYSTLRLLADIPNSPLLELYRQSLRQGVLPDRWTQSLIVPVPKPNSNKFRPISLTSCMCKVLERIVLSRLMLEIKSKLTTNLHGFLPGRSTHSCFAEYFIRQEPNTHVAFLDLQAAFDTANRELILEQLAFFLCQGGFVEMD